MKKGDFLVELDSSALMIYARRNRSLSNAKAARSKRQIITMSPSSPSRVFRGNYLQDRSDEMNCLLEEINRAKDIRV